MNFIITWRTGHTQVIEANGTQDAMVKAIVECHNRDYFINSVSVSHDTVTIDGLCVVKMKYYECPECGEFGVEVNFLKREFACENIECDVEKFQLEYGECTVTEKYEREGIER